MGAGTDRRRRMCGDVMSEFSRFRCDGPRCGRERTGSDPLDGWLLVRLRGDDGPAYDLCSKACLEDWAEQMARTSALRANPDH